jgi:hypothetical protein
MKGVISMKSPKSWMIVVVLLCACMLPVAGCDEEQGISSADVQAFASQVQQLNGRLDNVQVLGDQLKAGLQTTGIVDANLAAKYVKVNNEIDRVQPQVQQIAQAIKQAAFSPEDDTVTVLLKAAQAGNAASAPFNPYAVPVGIGLSLATVIAGFFAARERAKKAAAQEAAAKANAAAAENQLKYQSMKQGTEATKMMLLASEKPEVREIAAELYENIGIARADLGVK